MSAVVGGRRPVVSPAEFARVITPAQRDVLDVIADGGTAATAARKLWITPSAAHSRLGVLARATGMGDSAGLVWLAYRAGVFTPVVGDPVRVRDLPRDAVVVVGLVAEGLSNPEIAERVGLSAPQVQYRVSRLMRGLGAVSRPHVVRVAVDRGLLFPPPLVVGVPEGPVLERVRGVLVGVERLLGSAASGAYAEGAAWVAGLVRDALGGAA